MMAFYRLVGLGESVCVLHKRNRGWTSVGVVSVRATIKTCEVLCNAPSLPGTTFALETLVELVLASRLHWKQKWN
jgi:hypothetical protein